MYRKADLFDGGVDHRPNHDHRDVSGACLLDRDRQRRVLGAFGCWKIGSASEEVISKGGRGRNARVLNVKINERLGIQQSTPGSGLSEMMVLRDSGRLWDHLP